MRYPSTLHGGMNVSELYIGLMSGTSMDAVDGVLVDLTTTPRLLASHSLPHAPALKARLLALAQPGPDELDRLGQLDVELGRHFAACALALLAQTGMAATAVRAIGSHGQTVRHRPQGDFPFTLQIGDPNVIAEATGISVVADFRRRDVAAGGQGAPLVPACHEALFRSATEDRVALNLGGIANISILPAAPSAPVYGFDTGPANVLLDGWCYRHTGQPYDADGQWARAGQVHAPLLTTLLAHPYFRRPPPKSTGREEFHLDWLDAVLAEQTEDVAPVAVQATLTELTAASVAQAIVAEGRGQGRLLVCGGGAYNGLLLERLAALLPAMTVETTLKHGLPPSWVEAIAFAWLAQRTLAGRPGNLPAVTGARGLRVLGGIYPA